MKQMRWSLSFSQFSRVQGNSNPCRNTVLSLGAGKEKSGRATGEEQAPWCAAECERLARFRERPVRDKENWRVLCTLSCLGAASPTNPLRKGCNPWHVKKTTEECLLLVVENSSPGNTAVLLFSNNNLVVLPSCWWK